MKTNLKQLITAGLFLLAVSFVSCKKETSQLTAPVSDEEAQVISEENVVAEAEFDDLTEIGFSAGADLEATVEANSELAGVVSSNSTLDVRAYLFEDLRFKTGECTRITVEPNDGTFPKTVTIYYGDGCLCRDGKFRKGAIVLHYSAPIRRPGAVLTISLRNFHVNRAHIEGTKTISNLSENGVHKFSVQVEDGKISWPNGRGFTYAGIKVVTQVRGMETRTVRDDVYSIEGRSTITYANGTTITKNTESPLIKPVACKWIVQGILKIRINDRVLFIDFGNGDCDNKAILKWRDGEREITLP